MRLCVFSCTNESKQPPQCGGENLESEGKVRVQGNHRLSDGLYTKLLVMVVVRAEAINNHVAKLKPQS